MTLMSTQTWLARDSNQSDLGAVHLRKGIRRLRGTRMEGW
jgi:hypothetical protein